jgi:hypothetical protein
VTVDHRGAVLMAGVDQDNHVQLGTAAEEPEVLAVRHVHPLRRRMNLEQAGTPRMAAGQFI